MNQRNCSNPIFRVRSNPYSGSLFKSSCHRLTRTPGSALRMSGTFLSAARKRLLAGYDAGVEAPVGAPSPQRQPALTNLPVPVLDERRAGCLYRLQSNCGREVCEVIDSTITECRADFRHCLSAGNTLRMTELKTCPLCGAPGVAMDHRNATCGNVECGLFNGCMTIEQWQRRPGEDALQKILAECAMYISGVNSDQPRGQDDDRDGLLDKIEDAQKSLKL